MTIEKPRGGRINIRQILLVLLVGGIIYLVASHWKEVTMIAGTMRGADPKWLLAAALCQCAYFVFYSEMYRWAFRTVQIPVKPLCMLPTLLGSLVVGMVAPAWSAAGTALFVDDAIGRGESPARATTATLLAHTIDFVGFSMVLGAGLITLNLRHELTTLILISSGIFLLFTLAMVSVLMLGRFKPDWVHGLLNGIRGQAIRLFDALKRPMPFGDTWAEETTREFQQAAQSVEHYPARAISALTNALTAHLMSAFSLYLLFLAYDVKDKITIGPLIAGYAVGTLTLIVSPIPQGIGIVETAMATVFSTLGVPYDKAFVIAITFRGLTFWFPLLIGFFAISQVRSFQARQENNKETESPVDTSDSSIIK